jgi:hypothetical protein
MMAIVNLDNFRLIASFLVWRILSRSLLDVLASFIFDFLFKLFFLLIRFMSFAISIKRGQYDPELIELTFYGKLKLALLRWDSKRLYDFVLKAVVGGLLWQA